MIPRLAETIWWLLVLGMPSAAGGQTDTVPPPTAQPVHSTPEARAIPCGPASGALVLRLFDIPVRSFELTSMANQSGFVSLETLADQLRRSDLEVAVRELGVDELRQWPDVAVVHLGVGTLGPEAHFLVMVGGRGDGVLIDPTIPAGLDATVSWESLGADWSGAVALVRHPRWPVRWSVGIGVVAALGVVVGYAVSCRYWTGRSG